MLIFFRITLLVLFFIAYSCYTPSYDCEQFKTGTFEFETWIDGSLETTTFIRNDSLEIDYFRQKADTSTIRWINNCEYILKKQNPKTRAEEKAVHIKILTTEANTYTFEYKIVGTAKSKKGTARRIN